MGRWLLRLLVFALAAALTVLVIVPVGVDQYRRYEDARIIDQYQKGLERAGEEALSRLLVQCRSYNRRHPGVLLKDVFSQVAEDAQQAPLLEEIQANGAGGVLGVLEIPKIGVMLPIYPSSDGHATRNGAAFLNETFTKSADLYLASLPAWQMNQVITYKITVAPTASDGNGGNGPDPGNPVDPNDPDLSDAIITFDPAVNGWDNIGVMATINI